MTSVATQRVGKSGRRLLFGSSCVICEEGSKAKMTDSSSPALTYRAGSELGSTFDFQNYALSFSKRFAKYIEHGLGVRVMPGTSAGMMTMPRVRNSVFSCAAVCVAAATAAAAVVKNVRRFIRTSVVFARKR